MFDKVLNYKPSERDYLVWTVVHPGVWLIPILVVTLLIALAVHATVLRDGGKYDFYAPAAEAPAVEAAPAAEAPAAEAAPAE
jgi:hypothetical protein